MGFTKAKAKERERLPSLVEHIPLGCPGVTPAELAEQIGRGAARQAVTVALQRLRARGLLARSGPHRTGRPGPGTYRYWVSNRRFREALATLAELGMRP